MPLKIDKIPLSKLSSKAGKNLDRRVKITPEQKKAVIDAYTLERKAQRAIARETGISRRMISFILFPDRHEIQKRLFKERRKDGRYYHKATHTKAVASLRNYKREIITNQTT